MTSDDVPEVLTLEAELFPYDAWSAEAYRAELGGDSRYYVIAEEDGVIAGWAGLATGGAQADVMTIGVRHTAQRRGTGALLLTALLDEAKERGAPEVFLDVRVDNEPAIRLYERFGFTRVGLRKNYYPPDGTDAIVMRRDHQASGMGES